MTCLPKEKIPLQLMMTLPIGKSKNSRPNAGLTFIEVMIAAVILSAGLVGIYRSFLIGADVINHLTNRLYAHNLIEHRIGQIERDFKSLKDFDIGPLAEEIEINNKPVQFQYAIDLKPVGQLLSVFELDIKLSWVEKGRLVSISRSAYFSALSSTENAGKSP